jgi:hypothetical protein
MLKLKTKVNEAYEALKRVVMKDRYMSDASNLKGHLISERHTRKHDASVVWKEAEKLMTLLKDNSDEIEADPDPLYFKAKAFLLDTLDITGRYSEEWVNELIEKELAWLKDVQRLIEMNTAEAVELALAKLWLCLRVAEEYYRRGDYKEATNSIERLWSHLEKHVEKSEELLSLLMTGLTEEKLLIRKLHRVKKEQYHRGKHIQPQHSNGGASGANVWELCAEDLLALLGRIGLTEGKIYIRRARFSEADKSLEQCLRSISAWRELKIRRLATQAKSNIKNNARRKAASNKLYADVRLTENFALYGTAVAQCYLAFSYYRRGRFRRALTQVIPAGLTLSRSHWTFSNIFADMIHAGAERRLAGIHNEEHVREAKELCEKTVEFFDESILEGKTEYSLKPDHNGLNLAFFLRACYEISASNYYLAEIRENHLLEVRKSYTPDKQRLEEEVKEDMLGYLNEAGRYVGVIISCVKKTKPRDAAFWQANAYHLDALVIMKKAASYEQTESTQTEQAFLTAGKRIESAMESARQDISKWQQTEILSDQAYILNESARYYDQQVRMLKEERARIAEEIKHRDNPEMALVKESDLIDKEQELLAKELELTGKKRELAEKALERLEEAWSIASKMASDENDKSAGEDMSEPRPNFAGPIYLYRADSYALLGRKKDANTAFTEWRKKRPDVEYIRVIDLSNSVRERVERVDQTLVFNRDDKYGLKFAKLDDKLKEWLYEQAILGAKSDADAIELLGVSKATFYAWKKRFKKPVKRTS